jgi:hypothetical protein
MEFESIPARIEKMREALRHDFGPDAESDIREIDRAIESEIAKDPLLAYASNLFYKANIRLRQQRIEVARKLQSNGINENLYSLDILLWDSRLVDQLTVDFRPGEKLIEVKPFALVTNMRTRTRDELKRACRQLSEMNDTMFARNFTSDAEVHAAEARQRQRENSISPGGRGSVSNSDWRR